MAQANDFKIKIWNILPNKVLQRTMESVHAQLMRYSHARITAFQEPAVLDKSIKEHRKILRALENKDKRTLKTLIKSNGSLIPVSMRNVSNTTKKLSNAIPDMQHHILV